MPIETITGFKPINNADFPIVEDKHVLGGYHVVATETERDAIPPARKKVGMLVYVAGGKRLFRLSALNGWVEEDTAPALRESLTQMYETATAYTDSQIEVLDTELRKEISGVDERLTGAIQGARDEALTNHAEAMCGIKQAKASSKAYTEEKAAEAYDDAVGYTNTVVGEIDTDTVQEYVDNAYERAEQYTNGVVGDIPEDYTTVVEYIEAIDEKASGYTDDNVGYVINNVIGDTGGASVVTYVGGRIGDAIGDISDFADVRGYIDYRYEDIVSGIGGIRTELLSYAENKASLALSEANLYTDGRIGLSSKYTAKTYADKTGEDALNDAKTHTNTEISTVRGELGDAMDEAKGNWEGYTDTAISKLDGDTQVLITTGDEATLGSANDYTDKEVGRAIALASADHATAMSAITTTAATTLTDAKDYADGIVADALRDANTRTDLALTDFIREVTTPHGESYINVRSGKGDHGDQRPVISTTSALHDAVTLAKNSEQVGNRLHLSSDIDYTDPQYQSYYPNAQSVMLMINAANAHSDEWAAKAEMVSNRKGAINISKADNDHYPSTLAVVNYVNSAISGIGSGGLKIPKLLANESVELAGKTPGSKGDYYFIQSMDVTGDGLPGSAWWDEDENDWARMTNAAFRPDDATIHINTDGELAVKADYELASNRVELSKEATSDQYPDAASVWAEIVSVAADAKGYTDDRLSVSLGELGEGITVKMYADAMYNATVATAESYTDGEIATKTVPPSALEGYSPVGHDHADDYAPSVHTHEGYAPSAHTHTAADITDASFILRDENGRGQVPAPAAGTDIANKAYVDGATGGFDYADSNETEGREMTDKVVNPAGLINFALHSEAVHPSVLEGYSLTTHTHDYSLTYAPLSHQHAAADLPTASASSKGIVQLGAGSKNDIVAYTSTTGELAALPYTTFSEAGHHHDGVYAKIGHNHDDAYQARVAAGTIGNLVTYSGFTGTFGSLSPNTFAPASHTHDLPDATSSAKGVVKLATALGSDTTTALTPNVVNSLAWQKSQIPAAQNTTAQSGGGSLPILTGRTAATGTTNAGLGVFGVWTYATAANTNHTLMLRDANGKAQVTSPASGDPDATVATKKFVENYVDEHQGTVPAGPRGCAIWTTTVTLSTTTAKNTFTDIQIGDYILNTHATSTFAIAGVNNIAPGGLVKITAISGSTVTAADAGTIRGQKGDTGNTGATGAKGAGFYSVTAALANISAVSGSAIGDHFVYLGTGPATVLQVTNVSKGDIVKATSATAGERVGNIKGADGMDGVNGTDGTNGADGAPGAQGPRGNMIWPVDYDVHDIKESQLPDAKEGDIILNASAHYQSLSILGEDASHGDMVLITSPIAGQVMGNIAGPPDKSAFVDAHLGQLSEFDTRRYLVLIRANGEYLAILVGNDLGLGHL